MLQGRIFAARVSLTPPADGGKFGFGWTDLRKTVEEGEVGPERLSDHLRAASILCFAHLLEFFRDLWRQRNRYSARVSHQFSVGFTCYQSILSWALQFPSRPEEVHSG